jgi:hypothetical protein
MSDTVERPLDKPVTLSEMEDTWARVTRGHEIRTSGTPQGIRDCYVMDVCIQQIRDINANPAAFKKWVENQRNPFKFGRR